MRLSDALYLDNFSLRDFDAASDGMILQVEDKSDPALAAFAFDGEAGLYDIFIGYFDENDGRSRTTLRVDGRDIATWTWDAELGSANASAMTLTSKTFAGIELIAGSVVELVGLADGGEPLRIDAVRFEPHQPEPEPPITIEAEAATTLVNAQIRSLVGASDGMVLQAVDKSAPMVAGFEFDGQPGRFAISVDYFDENDGRSQTTLRVDGRDIGTWTWDAELGDANACAKTLTSKTFSGVDLTADLVVELVGRANGGEPLRIDAIRFERLESPVPKPEPVEQALAFAGAEGFGAETMGGRGGAVVHVTTLAESGVGSLRWALEDVTGPRIVVFDLEGQIALTSEITIDDPFVTIAGQTAPGAGIVVSGAQISIETHDVIMRGMRIRAGDGPGDVPLNRDNLAMGGNGDKGVENVIVDHNSFTWSVDESLSIWGSVRNVTVSNNLIAESLANSIHVDEGKTTTGEHSMGMIVGHGPAIRTASTSRSRKNLFVSNEYRNAMIKGADFVEFTNNYVVNFGMGHSALKLGGGDTPLTVAVRGNVYQDGRDTTEDPRPAFDLRSLNDGSKVYLKDNFVDGHREKATAPETDAAHGRLSMVTALQFFAESGATVLASDKVAAHVLKNAGARLVSGGLDAVDQRIVNGVLNGTSKIIDSQKEVGGYGVYKFTGAKVVDTDRDGMPDWFEKTYSSYGFDSRVADDKRDYDKDGFTNIEEYINGLIDGFDLI